MGIKYAVNENFFKTWNHNMAYVLGLWYADGSVEYAPNMRGCYLRLSSTDKSLIKSVRGLMESEHTIVYINRTPHKTSYLLRIGNKRLYEQLLELGITERKSNTITFPDLPQKYFASFLRGYFDGDGCVHIEKDPSGNSKRLTVIFTSGSKLFLRTLQLHLGTQASTQTNLKISKTTGGYGNAYQLRFSTTDSVKLFTLMYKYSTSETRLDRKLIKFKKFFSERKHWIDSEIQSILSHT